MFASIAPDLRLARARGPAGHSVDSWQGAPQREIRLKDVSFRYDDEREWALDHVSLSIRAGSAVAFVGANGSGKTTAADLIAGLLVASAGEVQIDGVTLTAANRAAWQSRIAYVPQDVFLLDTSIAHNIALGVSAGEIDRDRLAAAIRLAQLEELIRSLPGGLDYKAGEHAVRLSGGQRQRIGIARALYKDASVLILDEATNALDSATEQELTKTLVGLRGRYTTLLISHQPRTARMCDAVIEFAGGKVIGPGTDQRTDAHAHLTA